MSTVTRSSGGKAWPGGPCRLCPRRRTVLAATGSHAARNALYERLESVAGPVFFAIVTGG
ncbi:hypothetical protein [Amycolatopsis panacis]|uniref:hypothetical protein n=1 Tax=Amycolatopsis panacis TaxID=2340917 RepID=UPI0011C3D487|nr:hypothetical protein [Amycolatopsis panacis]